MHWVSLHLLMRGCVEQLKLDDPVWSWSSLVLGQSGPDPPDLLLDNDPV